MNEKIIEKLISHAIEQLNLAQWLTLRADLYSVEEDASDNLTASSMYHCAVLVMPLARRHASQ